VPAWVSGPFRHRHPPSRGSSVDRHPGASAPRVTTRSRSRLPPFSRPFPASKVASC